MAAVALSRSTSSRFDANTSGHGDVPCADAHQSAQTSVEERQREWRCLHDYDCSTRRLRQRAMKELTGARTRTAAPSGAEAAIEQRYPRSECELFGASSGQHPINQGGLRLTDGSTGHTCTTTMSPAYCAPTSATSTLVLTPTPRCSRAHANQGGAVMMHRLPQHGLGYYEGHPADAAPATQRPMLRMSRAGAMRRSIMGGH